MRCLIGVVHLPALPGSPQSSIPLEDVIDLAVEDAVALQQGGVDGIIVENFHDVPFRPGPVDAHTVATMTAACLAIRDAVSCNLGINVLRNDAAAALGIALAVGASFIRVNVHTGAMLTDQGVIEGEADETLRLRKMLGAQHIAIFADVLVKHAVPLGVISLIDAIRDTVERGLADAVIITGGATGSAPTTDDIRNATAASTVPVYVGSGVTAENVCQFVPPASGIIVGTSVKADGQIENRVDSSRVRVLRDMLDSAHVERT